jgi:hypothetical protein
VAIVAGKSYLMSAGAAGTLQYPTQGQNPGQWTLARLTNASPYPVVLRRAGQYLDTLPAWTANVFPLTDPLIGKGAVGGAPLPMTYQTVTPANLPPANSGDSTLYADYGLYGDTFPGSYPQPLAGQAVASAISGAVQLQNFLIGQQTFIASGGTQGPFTFTIPANTHSVRIWNGQAGGTLNLVVNGVQTGIQYTTGGAAGQPFAAGSLFPLLLSAYDTSIQVSIVGATQAGTLYIEGSSDPETVSALLNQQGVEIFGPGAIVTTPLRAPGVTPGGAAGLNGGGDALNVLQKTSAGGAGEQGGSIIVNNQAATMLGAPASSAQIWRITSLSFSNAPASTGNLQFYPNAGATGSPMCYFDLSGSAPSNRPFFCDWECPNGISVVWAVAAALRVTWSARLEYRSP